MDGTAYAEIALCGLYCGLCASRRRIPERARHLREALIEEGYDKGYFDIPGLQGRFDAFWKGLHLLATRPCAGCRAGGGYPECPIRPCAEARGTDTCPRCPVFPCPQLEALRRYPMYRADAERLRRIGSEAWVAEQERRAASGFCYADVRTPGTP